MAFTQRLHGSQQRHFANSLGTSRARAPRTAVRPAVTRTQTVVYAGFFDFLSPKPAQNQRAVELADQLIYYTKNTDAGLKVSPADKEQIEDLVNQLQPFCIKNPTRSKLLWGDYEVLYASNPQFGPFRSPTGQTLFPGQKVGQTLEEPNVFVNKVDYKTLGFLSGYARQSGEITFLSGDTYQVNLNKLVNFSGVGKPTETEQNVTRKFQIVYLDEQVRVVRFLPDADIQDSENSGNLEPSIFVFRRILDEVAQAAAAPVAQEEPADAPPARVGPFGGTAVLLGMQKKESLATQVERQALEADALEAKQRRFGTAVAVKPKPEPRGTRVAVKPDPKASKTDKPDPNVERARRQQEAREAREKAEAEKAAVRAKAEAEKAEAKAKADAERAKVEAKARAEAERARAEAERAEAKARAEAEKQAKKERQEAIKALLAELSGQLQEAQAEARQAVKDFKDAEKASVPVLKEVGAVRGKVAQAEAAVAASAEQLKASQEARKSAEESFKAAQAGLKEAEKSFKRQLVGAKV